jgi:PAS domain-containing protein
MKDVVWVMDLTTERYTYVSPSVERLLGYRPEDVAARPAQFFKLGQIAPQRGR